MTREEELIKEAKRDESHDLHYIFSKSDLDELLKERAVDCAMRYYQYSALNQESNEDILREHVTAFYDTFIKEQL